MTTDIIRYDPVRAWCTQHGALLTDATWRRLDLRETR